MTFVTAVIGSLVRAVVVTAFVLVISRQWSRQLNYLAPRGRSSLWVWILIPGLIPELLLGYAYAPWVIGHSFLTELACGTLVGLRLLPMGVIAWQLTPPSPLTRSAWHVLQLYRPDARQTRLQWQSLWVGPIQDPIPAGAVIGLLIFQEFELAGLLKATSWADWLFTSMQMGQTFSVLARAVLLPAFLQIAMIAGAIVCLRSNNRNQNIAVEELVPYQPSLIVSPLVWGMISWVLLIVVPLSSVVSGLPAGMVQLMGQTLRWQGLLRELIGNCAVSVAAACATWMLAGGVPPVNDRGLRRGWWMLIGIVCLPGLCGALVLSLSMLTLFQRSLLSGLYDTPAMWVLASFLFLLPRAVLLQLWLHHSDDSAVTIAQNLCASPDPSQCRTGRILVWRLRDEPRFLAVCFLAYASYLELTLAALLAPTGLPSGLVRLYNFLHFGRTSALSAEMAVLLGIPLLFAAVVWGLARKGRV